MFNILISSIFIKKFTTHSIEKDEGGQGETLLNFTIKIWENSGTFLKEKKKTVDEHHFR